MCQKFVHNKYKKTLKKDLVKPIMLLIKFEYHNIAVKRALQGQNDRNFLHSLISPTVPIILTHAVFPIFLGIARQYSNSFRVPCYQHVLELSLYFV
jgi:hypothetical protein